MIASHDCASDGFAVKDFEMEMKSGQDELVANEMCVEEECPVAAPLESSVQSQPSAVVADCAKVLEAPKEDCAQDLQKEDCSQDIRKEDCAQDIPKGDCAPDMLKEEEGIRFVEKAAEETTKEDAGTSDESRAEQSGIADSQKGAVAKEHLTGKDLVGKFVQKSFGDLGLFLGKIVAYYPSQGYYAIKYEDNDAEELEFHELQGILISDSDISGELLARKNALEELIGLSSRRKGRAKRSDFANKKSKGVGDKKVMDAVKKETRIEEAAQNANDGGEHLDAASYVLALKSPKTQKKVRQGKSDNGKVKKNAARHHEEIEAGEKPERKIGYQLQGDVSMTVDDENSCHVWQTTKSHPPNSKQNALLEKLKDDLTLATQAQLEMENDQTQKSAGKNMATDTKSRKGRNRPNRKPNNSENKQLKKIHKEGPEISEFSDDSVVNGRRPSRKRKASSEEDPQMNNSQVKRLRSRISVAQNSSLHEEGDCDIDDNSDENGSDENFHPDLEDDGMSVDSDNRDSEALASTTPTMDVDMPLPPMVTLPPSSGDLDVPENVASRLFSVYAFLRAFSDLLFLSPFPLRDFVGALNYKSSTTLIDSVHVSLLRLLKRHMEKLSKDGNEIAFKCLRHVDWNFLDVVTWPLYLAEYLLVQGFISKIKSLGDLKIVGCDYYKLSSETKLLILQHLCDDTLETEEAQTIISMRFNVEQEAEMEVGLTTFCAPRVPANNFCSSKRKRVSCSKDGEENKSVSNLNTEETTSTAVSEHQKPRSLEMIQDETLSSVGTATQDRNSDECRLCGMCGLLICCDNCPFSYHSRCIGIPKSLIPKGSWNCHECVMQEIDYCEPCDPDFRRLNSFVGSQQFGLDPYKRVFFGTCGYLLVVDEEDGCWYYNKRDVCEVLKVLKSAGALYDNMISSIMSYWCLEDRTKDENCLQKTEVLSGTSSAASVSDHLEQEENGITGHHYLEYEKRGQNVCSVTQNSLPMKDLSQNAFDNITERSGTVQETVEIAQITETFVDCASEQIELDLKPASLTAGELQGTSDTTSSVQAGNESLPVLAVDQKKSDGTIIKTLKVNKDSSNIKHQFKPDGYVNQYALGDVAASAGASLASLTTGNKPVNNKRSANKKTNAATMAEQQKIFSLLPSQFVWPSYRKKALEPLRERCGWCATCTMSVSCRRACLLSSTTNEAMVGAAKVSNGLRPTKNGEGHFPLVASYILHMEEGLRGLFSGKFETPEYRRQWRKYVEQASAVREIRTSLLELEENIRHIAFSPDWLKQADNWNAVPPSKKAQKGSTVNLSKKRMAKAIWWRGGLIPTQIFHWCALPRSTVQKAGRQGGSKMVSGLFYSDEKGEPFKRSRRWAWRMAVEKARTVSQIAVQVRYLDSHILWKDILYSEGSLQIGSQIERDVSSFKNSVVCEKKIVGEEIKYLLQFENCRSLPQAIVSHGIKTEDVATGVKYWLSERFIPLCVFSILEEKIPTPHSSQLFKFFFKDQNPKGKEARKRNVLDFLYKKIQMEEEKTLCDACNADLLMREAVKCSYCGGFCHEKCKMNDMIPNGQKFDLICFECWKIVSAQKAEHQKSVPKQTTQENVPKRTHLSSVCNGDGISPRKKLNMVCSNNGLIWKKNGYDSAMASSFSECKILFPGTQSNGSLLHPVCFLCREPYNPNLTYIACLYCQGWFHADAFGLRPDNITDLIGLKCHRCRKKAAPVCPYLKDSSIKRDKLPTRRSNMKGKQELATCQNGMDFGSCRQKTEVSLSLQDQGPMYAEPINGHQASKNHSFEYRETMNANQNQVHHKLSSEYLDPVKSNENQLYQDRASVCPEPVIGNDDQLYQGHASVCLEPAGGNQFPNQTDYFNPTHYNPVTDEGISPQQQFNWDIPVNDHVSGENQHGEQTLEEMCMEPYNGSEPLFSFQELLASEDNRVEEYVENSQVGFNDWGNFQNDNMTGAESQNGPMVSSYMVEESFNVFQSDEAVPKFSGSDDQLVNQFPLGVQFQGTSAQLDSTNVQHLAQVNTSNIGQTGRFCKVCGSMDLSMLYQCRTCRFCIHFPCYKARQVGLFTQGGWTCDTCAGVVH